MPAAYGAVAARFVDHRFAAMPGALAKSGYSTISAVGEDGEFWNKKEMHPRLGFQRSRFLDDYRDTEIVGMGLSDQEFFRQTAPSLTRLQKPFMAFLITLSNHHPFALPQRMRTLRTPGYEGTLVGNYLNSVHYFDSAFGAFISKLDSSGLLETSIVVVYGDHRAYLEGTEGFAKLLGVSPTNQFEVWKAARRLPLLIRLPGGKHAGVRPVVGGHLDIAPTLLSLLGIQRSRMVGIGVDLTRGQDAFVTFRDGGFTDGEDVYIVAPVVGDPSCFRFRTGLRIECAILEAKRKKAAAKTRMSDLIVERNLIPFLPIDP